MYENYLVPLIFEPYAADLASRVVLYQPSRVLEIAAGTGVVTRHLARVMPKEASIVATDLNQPMLDQAVAIQAARPIEWLQADAMQLPFPDATFDVVVCQFGVMFFPDKVKAFSEAWRVLRWGGHFLFNVWDRIEENEFADTVTRALAALFPKNPPQFLARIPHGYADVAVVAAELGRGGFSQHPTFRAWLPVAARHRRLCRQLPIAKARRFAANLKLVALRPLMTPLPLPRRQSGAASARVLSTAKFGPTSSSSSDKVNFSAVG